MIGGLERTPRLGRDDQRRALVLGIVGEGHQREFGKPVRGALHYLPRVTQAAPDLRDRRRRGGVDHRGQHHQLHLGQPAHRARLGEQHPHPPAQPRDLVGESFEIGEALRHGTSMSN